MAWWILLASPHRALFAADGRPVHSPQNRTIHATPSHRRCRFSSTASRQVAEMQLPTSWWHSFSNEPRRRRFAEFAAAQLHIYTNET